MIRTLNAATLRLNSSTETCRLVPYDDARPDHVLKPGDKIVGHLTVGYGHCGPDVEIGKDWTQAQADAAQIKDLATAEDAVQAALDEGHVTMTDNQFGATTDFVFNCGVGEFERSTARKLIVAGKLSAVPAEFQRYIYSKGKKMGGLVTRRAKESLLYDTPDATPITLPAAAAPSMTPDPVATPRVWTSKPVISSCIAGIGAIGTYAPDLRDGFNSTVSQLQPYASDFGPHWLIALKIGVLGSITFGGIAGFMKHQKDASST